MPRAALLVLSNLVLEEVLVLHVLVLSGADARLTPMIIIDVRAALRKVLRRGETSLERVLKLSRLLAVEGILMHQVACVLINSSLIIRAYTNLIIRVSFNRKSLAIVIINSIY